MWGCPWKLPTEYTCWQVEGDCLTPVLFHLHWLSAHSRAQFEVLFLTFKTFYGSGPQYLQECLSHYEAAWTLRSSYGAFFWRQLESGDGMGGPFHFWFPTSAMLSPVRPACYFHWQLFCVEYQLSLFSSPLMDWVLVCQSFSLLLGGSVLIYKNVNILYDFSPFFLMVLCSQVFVLNICKSLGALLRQQAANQSNK